LNRRAWTLPPETRFGGTKVGGRGAPAARDTDGGKRRRAEKAMSALMDR
jgi:hypothetical protein